MAKEIDNQVILAVIKDNSVAVLKCLPFELDDGFLINEEIVRIIINRNRIKNEVKWLAIKKAIKNVIATKKPIYNLVISRSTSIPQKILHFKVNRYYQLETLRKLMIVWSQLGKILTGVLKSDRLLPAYFYKKNEIIFEISSPKFIDVYGVEVIISKKDEVIKSNDTVYCETLSDRHIYRAKTNGYLIVDENGLVGIQSLLQISEMNTHLTLNYYPITAGAIEFDTFCEEIKAKFKLESIPDFKSVTEPFVNVFTLKRGVLPISGKNAEVNWHFKINDGNDLNFNENLPFKKIFADTLIAIKRPYLEGRNGVDIFGEIIPVLQGEDIILRIDNSIAEKIIDGCIHYIAVTDGVFFKINNSISIENAMFIDANIDGATGSIDHKGSVVIFGDIKSGFSITCEKKLYIKGSVENNCKIICNGDISILYGVVGVNTLVQASGFCDVGFVTDAKIISTEDLVVYKYSFNANLFSRGVIEIKGQSIRNRKCALIGGVANSLNKLITHSIGSEEIMTSIVLGKDIILEEKIIRLKQSLPSFDVNLLNLNKRVNYLTKSGGEKVQKLFSPEIRDELKKIIVEIKQIQENKIKINSVINKYQQLLFVQDSHSLNVVVLNYLIPEVYVRMLNQVHRITEKFHSKLQIVLKSGKVCVENRENQVVSN